MKLTFVFLLISPILFAQNNDSEAMCPNEQVVSLIMGDWDLTQVEIIDGYNIFSISSRIKLKESRTKQITITSDSIYNHRDTTLRYYVRNQNFTYKIQYDSIVKSNYLKLYSEKRRKLLEVESYEIINCTIDELVIKSYQFLNNGLDYTSFSIIYTYRKNGVSNLLNEISGDWFYCSEQGNTFMSDNDSLSYVFTRASSDSICKKSDNHIDLEFIRDNYENVVNVAIYDEYSGVFGKSKFSISPINKLIYLRTKNEVLVYNFNLSKKGKLILSLDKERTRKVNTHNNTYTPLLKSRFE